MKTLEEVKLKFKSNTLDGRDLNRLMEFVPESELKNFGVELKDEWMGRHKHKEFTRENILEQLKEDVVFGYEKACNERGISSWLMYEVVRMWNWILEEGLENLTCSSDYAISYFETTANKYNINL